MDKELIAEVIIHKYIRNVVTSESRRATYYKQGENLSKKYILGKNCHWMEIKKKGTLLVDEDGELIVKNSKAAGTQKTKRINGQDLHALTLMDYDRSKIIKAIKKQMVPEVAKLEPINIYPLIIECDLYDTFMDMEYIKADGKPKDVNWDIDNRFIFYGKVLPDVLTGCLTKDEESGLMIATSKVIIPDDSRKWITQSTSCLFFPIENTEDRKLVFRIYHDKRDIITQSKYYQ